MSRVLLALALLAIGFGGGLGVGLMTHPEAHIRTVRTTTIEVVNGTRTAQRTPAPIPTLLEGSTDPHRLALSSAVPIDANLDSAEYVTRPPRQLIVTWDRAHLTRDGQPQSGSAGASRSGRLTAALPLAGIACTRERRR